MTFNFADFHLLKLEKKIYKKLFKPGMREILPQNFGNIPRKHWVGFCMIKIIEELGLYSRKIARFR